MRNKKRFILCIILLLFQIFCFSQNLLEQKVNFAEKPSWVKEYPFPELKEYDNDLVLIQKEYQYNHITKERFHKLIYYVKNVYGKKAVNKLELELDPEYYSFTMHSNKIYRNGEVIDLIGETNISKGYFEITASNEVYDINGKLLIQFDKVEVGDIFEISYTIKGIQPDIDDTFFLRQDLYIENLRGSYFTLVVENEKNGIEHKILNANIPIETQKKNGVNYHEFEYSQDKSKVFYNQVGWHSEVPTIYLFTRNEWKDIVDLNLKNHQLDTPVSPLIKTKVEELTKNSKTLEEKILKVLDYTQKEIHYLAYGLIDPKKPDATLKQNLGDCKSKSLLTIKMLEVLGVEAWPVIVNSRGFDERLLDMPSLVGFDHEVIQYVFEDDVLLFDSTTIPQHGSLQDRQVHKYRYGLRIIPGENKMIKLPDNQKNELSLTVNYIPIKDTIQDKNSTELKRFHHEMDMEVKGNMVDFIQSQYLQNRSNFWLPNDSYYFMSAFSRVYESYNEVTYDFNEKDRIINISTKKHDKELVYDSRYLYSQDNDEYYIPHPVTILNIEEKEKIGKYFVLTNHKNVEVLLKIKKAPWINNFDANSHKIKTDWIDYKNKTWEENDTIYSLVTANFLKSSLESSRYEEVKKVQDEILKLNNVHLFKKYEVYEYKGEKYYYDSFYLKLFISVLIILIVIPIVLIFRIRKKNS
ncbi:DUF3857 domain-containing protein [Aureivirga sp. CE67]|uniref:DUF3857 domain-containing protein n=1 Tax=Aureivirga sp. CE67 TaxID=1788983 RepID=UPI0018CBB755|nr:DUF3857 domain-containing protein [Aureivirga sp. CE67]